MNTLLIFLGLFVLLLILAFGTLAYLKKRDMRKYFDMDCALLRTSEERAIARDYMQRKVADYHRDLEAVQAVYNADLRRAVAETGSTVAGVIASIRIQRANSKQLAQARRNVGHALRMFASYYPTGKSSIPVADNEVRA